MAKAKVQKIRVDWQVLSRMRISDALKGSFLVDESRH